jgi:hypothetical protein
MRLAGQYEMVLGRLMHNLYTAQVCTRTLAVLTVVCFAQSLQTNAKIVFQLGHHHFLENCQIVGCHSIVTTLKSSRVMLNTIVNATDKSGNLKKRLRHEIHETVSKLRKLVFTLKSELIEKKEENHKMSMEIKQLKDTLDKEKSTSSARQVATCQQQ